MSSRLPVRGVRHGNPESILFGLTMFLAVAFAYSAAATNHILRQDQLMAGFNGDPSVQYIVITVGGNDQKAWGPQGGESSSRAMLAFFNSNGVQTGTFFFPNNPPQGGLSVLIATTNFANLPGAPIPDILIPPLIQPGSGKVVFRGNPLNPFRFDVNLALSYGNFPANLTEGAGPPAPGLPMTGEPVSLTRVQDFGFGSGTSANADFALMSAVPLNTRGQTFTFPVDGPEIDASLSSIDFGSRNIAAGPTSPRTVVLTSRGTLNGVAVSGIFLAGVHSNDFQITSGGGSTVLAPGATRNVTLTFDPSVVGNRTATLRITANDTNEPVTDIPLTGVGIDPNAPDINPSLTNIDFGTRDIALGAGGSVGEIIANVGTIGTLVISNLSLIGANTNDFRIFSDTGQGSLGPGASRAVSLIFVPTSAGPKSATLRILSNDPDEGLTLIPISAFAFDLNPCTAPNPTNSIAQDAATNAMLVCPGMEFTGTMPAGAPDGTSSCPSAGGDMWFRYVPAASGVVTVNLQGIGAIPVLSAFSAAPATVANELACQSAAGSNSTIAQITIPVSAGVAIFLRAAMTSATPGSQFRLAMAGPSCFDFDRNRNGTTDVCESDFGSAPAPYPTTLAQNGARHRAFTGVFLGARVDANDDGLPSAGATGDKLDGPDNDEDGVVWTSALTVGQAASLNVTASTNGLLNAWIDFNVDGDWADAGEQVFTNFPLVAGGNLLSIAVPATASATNRTYARFRFNTAGNLSFTGAANDGEVEDYAVEILPASVAPGALQVRFNELLAGMNGDSTVQFVELEVNSDADKLWGPQAGETAGRAMLAFFDETGAQSGRYVFPSNAPAGGSTVLVATRSFWEQTGLRPDFVMPPEVSAIGGKVAFQANPDNVRFSMNISLSYGGNRYFGNTAGGGPANTNEVPIVGARSLTRTDAVPFGVNKNGAFTLAAPTPRNTAGQTVALAETPIADQGRTLFTKEIFRGNGRTCATCHIGGGRDQFGLTSLSILDLPEDDPLFIFEENVNVMRLVVRSQPSDLRGRLTGTLGSGRVLAGSGDTFLVVGSTNLAGLVMDTNGNVGILQSITLGSLSGPTTANGSARGLEDHSLLEHGRGLILENIDGFKEREVFRMSPHLLNIALTAPYGLSGEFSNLEDFSAGAVMQHFPRTLNRVSGVDFRQPTRAELAAMTQFMNGISEPADKNLNLDRLATTEAQKRGRILFFNNEGKCSQCHSGPAFNLADGTLFGSRSNINENFNTGVANQLLNIADGLPTEPAGLAAGQSTRLFNTPTLMGVRLTAPFFHDGSAPNLTEAVKFYDTEQFLQSPAGQLVGTILAANRPEKIADLVAFLESLVGIPVDFTRSLSFGVRCPGTPIQGPLTATVTNLGTTSLTITNVTLKGTNAAEFSIVGDSGQTTLAPGQTRTVTVAFSPSSTGGKRATLEFDAVENNLLGRFSFGVAVSGADVDSVVTAAPAAFNFGIRDIDAPPSPEVSLLITNEGTTSLDVSGLSVTGLTPQDFIVTTDTSPLAAHEVRVVQISFSPRTQGAKSASIRIPVLACNTALLDIPLTGTASSSVHHLGWDPLGSTQYVGTAFQVRVTAQDRNNDTVAAFGGVVRLMSVVGTQTNTVLIAPTNSGPFASGIWTGSITVQQPSPSMRLLAFDTQGHTGISGAFLAPPRDDLSITATDSPDPLLAGQPLTYSFTVHNTGPTTATGVTMTDILPPGLSFSSGTASQGLVTQSGGTVVWQIGALARGISVTGSVVALPVPGFAFITNVATVTRVELESNLFNNTVTNVTSVQPFGWLTVTPVTNLQSAGLSGGPFTPVNHVFVLSNAGNATLNWATVSSGCNTPSGLVSWWPGEGNAMDIVGTNHGSMQNGATFAPGLVGQGFLFDGVNDFVLIPDSESLRFTSELTVEMWFKGNSSVGGGLIDKRGGGRANYGIFISPTDVQLYFDAGGGFVISTVTPLPTPNVFHHIAGTYRQITSNNIELVTYLDGQAVRTQVVGGNLANTTNNMFVAIGGVSGGCCFFQGIIDEVAVYNRALGAAEIHSIFDAGAAGKCQSPGSSGAGSCTPPSGLSGWWPLDDSLVDVAGTNSGGFTGNPAFTNGLVGRALAFDGVDDGVRFSASPSLNVGTSQAFTLESWVIVPDLRLNPIFEWNDESVNVGPHLWISQSSAGTLYANIVDSGNTSHTILSPPNVVTAGLWQHVALTYNKASGMAKLFVNGAVVQQQNLGNFTPKTSIDFWLGRRATIGFLQSLAGAIDEPSVSSREFSEAEIQSIFFAGVAGKCRSQSWFSQSPFSGTLTPGARTNLTISIRTNAAGLAVGSYSTTLLISNVTNARGSTDRTVSLQVINRPPTLNPLPPVSVAEDSGPRTVALNGISAGGSEKQLLTVSAVSDNPALIPNPIAINYTNPAPSGLMTLLFATNAVGTSVVSVIVRDDGGTSGGSIDSVTNKFLVTVTPVNDPPVLAAVADQIVNEGALLLVTNLVTDPDLPGDQFTFLLLGPPAGAGIDPGTGVFAWQPGEAQGPATNVITVVVRDNGTPQLSATNRFNVRVLEVNAPPVFATMANLTVLPGVPVNFSVSASDTDLPPNILTFSLGPGSPSGASINPSNGVLSWTPPGAPLPKTNVFNFVVADNGTPVLSDQKSVAFVVVPQPVIQTITTAAGTVTIQWTSLAGLRYRVQSKANLGDSSWTDLPGDVTASGATALKIDTAGGNQRFYRVTVLP